MQWFAEQISNSDWRFFKLINSNIQFSSPRPELEHQLTQHSSELMCSSLQHSHVFLQAAEAGAGYKQRACGMILLPPQSTDVLWDGKANTALLTPLQQLQVCSSSWAPSKPSAMAKQHLTQRLLLPLAPRVGGVTGSLGSRWADMWQGCWSLKNDGVLLWIQNHHSLHNLNIGLEPWWSLSQW